MNRTSILVSRPVREITRCPVRCTVPIGGRMESMYNPRMFHGSLAHLASRFLDLTVPPFLCTSARRALSAGGGILHELLNMIQRGGYCVVNFRFDSLNTAATVSFSFVHLVEGDLYA